MLILALISCSRRSCADVESASANTSDAPAAGTSSRQTEASVWFTTNADRASRSPASVTATRCWTGSMLNVKQRSRPSTWPVASNSVPGMA
jgi:hypothetical protein